MEASSCGRCRSVPADEGLGQTTQLCHLWASKGRGAGRAALVLNMATAIWCPPGHKRSTQGRQVGTLGERGCPTDGNYASPLLSAAGMRVPECTAVATCTYQDVKTRSCADALRVP